MSRKKARFNNDSVFETPYSLAENLSGSVDNLTNVVKTLKFTSELLKGVNKEMTREKQATQCEQTHELVSERDIQSAREEISIGIIPECEQLIREAEKQLDVLQVEETNLISQVNELEEMKKESIHIQPKLRTAKRKRSEFDSTELEKRQRKLMDLISEQQKVNLQRQLEIDEIKRSNMQITTQMENMQSVQEIEQKERALEQELIELEKQEIEKQQEVAERKKTQKNRSNEPSEPSIHQKIQQFTSYLGFIENALKRVCQPEFAATQSDKEFLEIQYKKYIQALQKEKIYLQMDDEKHKQSISNIEQIKSLCKHSLAFKLGKTSSVLLEYILNHQFEINIDKLLELFPSNEEKRHCLTIVLLHLLNANIFKLNNDGLKLEFHKQ